MILFSITIVVNGFRREAEIEQSSNISYQFVDDKDKCGVHIVASQALYSNKPAAFCDTFGMARYHLRIIYCVQCSLITILQKRHRVFNDISCPGFLSLSNACHNRRKTFVSQIKTKIRCPNFVIQKTLIFLNQY